MQKLADIGLFESLEGSSSAVFNFRARSYESVKDVVHRCDCIQHCVNTIRSLVEADMPAEGDEYPYLKFLAPEKVLMLDHTAEQLEEVVQRLRHNIKSAVDVAEIEQFHKKLKEVYSIDTSRLDSDFDDCLDVQSKVLDGPFCWGDTRAGSDKEQAWLDYYNRFEDNWPLP